VIDERNVTHGADQPDAISIVEIWRSYQFGKISQRHYPNRGISGNDTKFDL